MARLAITGDLSELHIELSTWDRLLAMHRKVHASLLHVRDARPWGGEFLSRRRAASTAPTSPAD